VQFVVLLRTEEIQYINFLSLENLIEQT